MRSKCFYRLQESLAGAAFGWQLWDRDAEAGRVMQMVQCVLPKSLAKVFVHMLEEVSGPILALFIDRRNHHQHVYALRITVVDDDVSAFPSGGVCWVNERVSHFWPPSLPTAFSESQRARRISRRFLAATRWASASVLSLVIRVTA